jgi:hypothetical protein
MVDYGILSPAEADFTRMTGQLPNDILKRLNLIDKANKN